MLANRSQLAVSLLAIVPVLGMSVTARADEDAPEAYIRARLPVGPDAAAPGLGGSIDGGWGGAHAKALGAVTAEALISSRITVRATVEYDVGRARPSAFGSYQFYDPYKDSFGLLAGVALKSEGLTEAEGEMEVTVAVSRRVGPGLLAGSLTFGADPDFHDHDGEVALSLVEPVIGKTAVGGVARARSGLGSSTELGADWDAIGGAVARAQVGAYTVTAIGGVEALGPTMGGAHYGALGTLALGAWW